MRIVTMLILCTVIVFFMLQMHPLIMRDFRGLEEAQPKVLEAMMDFSFHLTLGNMDEAFKAIKLIKSDEVILSVGVLVVLCLL